MLENIAYRQIELDRGTAAYREWGEGETILFLHGFLGSGENWQRLLPYLQSDFHCIALDLLGFGASAKPHLNYTIWHQIEFLQQFMTALNLSRVHLVGHSYGGWLASAYAIAASGIGWTPEKTAWSEESPPLSLIPPASITLVAPAGIRDDKFVGRNNHLKLLLWETPLIEWGLKALIPLAYLCRRQKELAQIRQAREALVNQPVARYFLLERLRPEDAIDTVERYLNKLQMPIQIVAGAQDRTIPLWHCETYAQSINQAELNVLPEAGHDLLQTHPETLATLIKNTCWHRVNF